MLALQVPDTWAGFNAQRCGWPERSVKELGTDVKRVAEVWQEIVDIAHVFFLGDVEVIAGGDGRLGDIRLLMSLPATVVIHLPRKRRPHTLQNIPTTELF